MAKKKHVPSISPPPNRHSSTIRITGALLAAIMIGGLIAAIVANSGGSTSSLIPQTTLAASSCPAEDGSDAPLMSFSARPTWCLASGFDYTAVFDTTEGEIRVALDIDRTPETVNNFAVLTRYGYYDNTSLFRFDPSIAIIQGGSPHTNDWTDPGPGYTIPDEGGMFTSMSDGSLLGPFTYQPGQLVMARSGGPNASSAQFFFTTGPEVSLLDNPGTYLVFGQADEAGLAVLQAMMDLYVVDETSPYGGGPSRSVDINSVTIVATTGD
ncbi:MAG TPA: peptidylprolyl isomerase [Acidimicrobiia bacterium]|jgi:cyclophilin family peptidyl-prolyl cis-trans isomerase|nr:peptidylprolyl isomerase [Acidimicrobiia bacterium]HIL47054.1 peptidylprolyl isomerase [Acidimicrobiia bacterium]